MPQPTTKLSQAKSKYPTKRQSSPPIDSSEKYNLQVNYR